MMNEYSIGISNEHKKREQSVKNKIIKEFNKEQSNFK